MPGADAVYISHVMGRNQIRRAVMVVDDAGGIPPEQLKRVIAHEMGHAYHADQSFSTYQLNDTGIGTRRTRHEQKAVKESIADINEIIFTNYTGSGFSVPSNFSPVSVAGDYSNQFDYGDISGAKNPYVNGQVGGHAFYELVQFVGFERAARIFLISISYLQDDDRNNQLSFMELRQAMIDAAKAMELPAATINAVNDSWNDVGVGGPSQGATVQPVTTPPPRQAPPAPASVSVSLSVPCQFPWTGYLISYGRSSGATFYEVYHRFGSGPWQLTGFTTSNPETFWTTGNAQVTIRACNAAGCSRLSDDVENAPNKCL